MADSVALNSLQRAALANVIDRLDVFVKHVNLTGHHRPLLLVNKTHLVTHLADIFSVGDPTFHREAFYDACGLTQEERYLG